jgi:hypothetical protein
LASKGVFVLTAPILVCPSKAGLYLVLGAFVSTGATLVSIALASFTLGVWLAHAVKKMAIVVMIPGKDL